MNRVHEKKHPAERRPSPAEHGARRELNPIQDCTEYVREYARQRPQSVALACLGVGFILGWKLKLW